MITIKTICAQNKLYKYIITFERHPGYPIMPLAKIGVRGFFGTDWLIGQVPFHYDEHIGLTASSNAWPLNYGNPLTFWTDNEAMTMVNEFVIKEKLNITNII